MSTIDLQKNIINATSPYFDDPLNYLNLSRASEEYRTILDDICGHDMNVQEGRDDIEFDNGKSLGTFWAALCLEDIVRTRKFIRGINAAIQDKLKTKKTLHILYAGTGPFATLLLPLILRYSQHDISYTLMEVNPFSFKILQTVISKLDLQEYAITLVNADATKYQIDANNEPDIIVSETMQNALAKEQQVPIFLNLMQQVKNECTFIPESIRLHIGLKKAGIPMIEILPEHYHKAAQVLDISEAAVFPGKRSKKEISFAKKETIIENEKLAGFDQLVIITEIQVYKNEKISISESGLTTPIYIGEILENSNNPIKITTQYKIYPEPKLEYKVF